MEKNESGEDFLRLKFPIVDKEWNSDKQTLSTIFSALLTIINRPPIIKSFNENQSNYQ